MLKRIISTIFFLCFFSTTAFAHTGEIQITGENKYKAIRLTPEIYNNSNSDLSDILIKDNNGENVPYFINTGFQKVYEGREGYPMKLINSYTNDNSFYFDYKLTAEGESDTVATSVEVSTNNTNFAKIVDVYGSYDNLHWEFIQNDKLYNIDDKSKLSIEFNKPQKYTHYRFKLANNLEKISFEAVNLVYSIAINEKNYFIEDLTPTFSIEEKDKTTLVKIEGLKNLRLCSLTIETDSMFKRTAKAPLASGKEIYNLSLNETSYTDTTLPLDWQISQEDIYIITITNNDDKPINITGITVRYYADDVVFEGNANESYTFYFGADATKTSPVYDITKYKDEILKGTIDKVTISAINYDKENEKSEERDYKVIFNIVVTGITVLLGGLFLFRLRRIPD
ncbi:hypothetical protein [Lacrimispora sp.]|uniref:hypothetical protein n=1 Tax=Lacrimispora sp. TaxID=2719234 RepID=UPI0028AEE3AD|nr:hypothetical protein [Lacrimispora sp.]